LGLLAQGFYINPSGARPRGLGALPGPWEAPPGIWDPGVPRPSPEDRDGHAREGLPPGAWGGQGAPGGLRDRPGRRREGLM